MPPTSIAVVGGGITGLSAAFHLSRRYPQAQIRLFEKSKRSGGWLNSRRVDVKGYNGEQANVLLEAGPRTLRPKSGAVLELVNLLGLQDQLITPNSSSAKERFLHIPGRRGLSHIPSSLLNLFSSPYLVSTFVGGLLHLAVRGKKLPEGQTDESFGALVSRLFGPGFERTFASALVHGIYAADARLLSAKAAFPSIWDHGRNGRSGLLQGLTSGSSGKSDPLAGYDVGDVANQLKGAAVFSFVDGMDTLSRSLRARLESTANVTLKDDKDIIGLRPSNASDDIEIFLANGESTTASKVVSAIPLPALSKLTTDTPLPHLTTNPYSSVTVINIVFPPTKRPIHPPGFGYLIPRPRNGYTSRTSGMLGVVFDSCALPQQDRGSPGFTRLTVMLGGPYAPMLTAAHTKAENVLAQLQLQLAPRGPRLPWPVYYEAIEQRDCIPLPTVGHVERMEELKQVLKDGPWRGRLEVVGAGVGGVSVGDCVEAGRNVGKEW